ncbi:hypothetical protein BSKO_07828 [Bryopsis sp. KO-2023]|nr:hypothetical protein BSKO_07828 [Bryopsis sp. KO-2023]
MSPLPRVFPGLLALCLLLVGASARTLQQAKSAKGKADKAGKGFLSDALPLKITVTTPANLADGKGRTLVLQQQQALTVVFSRSVTSLGEGFGTTLADDKIPFTLDPPLAGNGRWVTTYIYRFDPDGDWPPDSETQLKWNAKLKSHDGIPVELPGNGKIVLTTESLTMDIFDVTSERLDELTGGAWDANVGMKSDILPEVPPDGKIELRFSYPVETETLAANLKVFNLFLTEETVEIAAEPCEDFPEEKDAGPGESSCAMVNVTSGTGLEKGNRFVLTMEAGVKYSSKAGPLKNKAEAPFGSIRAFRLPFETGNVFVRSRNLDMWVPHGLPDGFPIASLKGVMRLNNALTGAQIPFDLQQVDNSTLRIQAALEPSQTYRINVIGSSLLKDGLGLPLERSTIEFETDDIPAEFQSLQSGTFPSLSVFEEGQDWGQKIVALSKGKTVRTKAAAEGCKDVGSLVEIWNLDEEPSVVSSFNIVRSSSSRSSLESILKKPDETLEPEDADASGDAHEVSVASLLETSGALAHQYCSSGRYKFHLTVETDLQVLFLRSGASGSAPATGTAWITSMSTGKPVEGANVKVYNRESNSGGLVAAKDYALVSKGTSDELGRAALKLGNKLGQLDALVEYNEKFLFIPRIDIVQAASNDVLDTLVLDRKLVKPLEELNVKGYVMQRDGSSLSPILLKNARLVVSPTFNRTKEALASNGGFTIGGTTDTFPVTVNKKFGSFQASIAVPVDAPLTTYRISFEAVGAKGGPISGSSETFVVGDPRPPTVQLLVDAPKWALPASKVSIDVEAVSFIGAPVGGANMDVTWTVSDFTREEEDEELEGTTTIKTDSDGTGTAVIDLSVFKKPPSVGSILDATIEWVGPTRELITEEVSIPLEVANVKFEFTRSSTTDLPKRSFSVRVNVTDLEGEALPKLSPVTLELKKLREPEDPEEETLKPTSGAEPIDGFSVEDCETTSGAFEFDCRFSMPVIGEYAVEACVESGKATVCGREFMGLSAEQWKENPLQQFPDVGLTELSKGPYKVGSVAKFALENPFVNAHAFIAWGSELGMKQKVVTLEDVSLNELEVPVDDVCEANCAVYVAVAVPRQRTNAGIPLNIIVHPLFDPASPHTKTFTRTIEAVQDRSVAVSIEFPKLKGEPVIAPGESTPVEVTASGPAEVTLVVVDKAILELVPLKLKDLAAEFVVNLAMRFSETSTSDFLVSPQAIETLVEKFLQRNELNPWAFTITDMLPSFSNVDLALSDEDYVDSIRQFITEVPVSELDIIFSPRLLSAEVAASPGTALSAKVSADDAEAPAEEERGLVRIQKDFVSTPTFETTVTKAGKATISFSAPDNLGTFAVRAYVVTDDGKFGSEEEELIVRRTVSLTPSAPRFARIGDVFEGGAVVTITGIKKASVAVTVTANSNLDIVGSKSVKVSVGSDGQEEVRFNFKATKIGEAEFTISADAGSGSKDSLKISFPVEGLQEQVTLGSSFSVPASAKFVEVLDLPRALAGSGSVKINAGVGQLPAVLSMIQDIFEENLEKECPIDADFALAAVAIPVIAEAYGVLDFDDNLIGKETLELVDSLEPAYIKGFLALGVGNMTDIKRGLQYSLPCPEDRNDEREKPLSLRQNAKGAWIYKELLVDAKDSELEAVANGTAGISSLNALWSSSTAGSLVQEATELRKKSKSQISANTVAMARAALGADWAPPTGSSKDVVADLSMERLSKDFDEMSVEGQAFYILTRLANDEGSHPDVKKATDTWTSNTRAGGRTAYIAQSEGSAAAASNVANALALLAMVKAGVSNGFLPKLSNYVARPPVSQFGFRAHTNFDKITAMTAIRAYDQSTGSAVPNIRLIIKSGKEELMNFVLNDAKRPVSTVSVPWESLASPPKPLEVSAEGVGEISIAVSMTFVPTKLLPFPTFNGIFVERGIRIAGDEESNEAGPSLAVVPVGSIVIVNVQITTPDELGSTSVRVLMPAGLEPVDPNVEQEGNACPLPFFEFFGPRFFFSCPVQETSPTVVTFTYDSLTAGAHDMTFRAIAAAAGEFALPPVRAFVNDQPEIMGLSSAGSVEICSGKGCKPVAEKPLSIPKTCPKDCNGLGACDVESGSCVCLDGFKGKDCGKFT